MHPFIMVILCIIIGVIASAIVFAIRSKKKDTEAPKTEITEVKDGN